VQGGEQLLRRPGVPFLKLIYRRQTLLEYHVELIYCGHLEITYIADTLSLKTHSAGILRYSPACVEGKFSAVRMYGVLGS
jgi:hypothetical protein